MKKLIPALVFVFYTHSSFAEWDMAVCDSADESGNCIGKSTSFSFSGTELNLKAMLVNADGLHTNKVYFELYLMDPATYNEDLLSTDEVKTEESQKNVWQTIRIAKKGHYILKARDAFKDYITSREIEIK